MHAKVAFNGETLLEGNFPNEENDFWHMAAQPIAQLKEPGEYTVDTDQGCAQFNIIKRGRYIKDGIEYPSLFVTEKCNWICLPHTKPYQEKYLTCVNPESNNYKFYWFIPQYDGISAKYGRIGSNSGEMFGERSLQTPFPEYMFWIRYYEKIGKGYTDQSDVYLNDYGISEKTSVPELSEDTAPDACKTPGAALWNMLLGFSKQYVERNLKSSRITKSQAVKAREIFNELRKAEDTESFNSILLELIAVSPRRTRWVDVLLADSEEDFDGILEREESLVTAMEGAVFGVNTKTETDDPFAERNIEVYEATNEQKEHVLSRLSARLRPKVLYVYRVIDHEGKRLFDEHIEHMHKKYVRQVWHGSKNQNWLSILINRLQFNPNAVRTGRMLGRDTIYAAVDSEKPWRYGSSAEAMYTSDRSDIAIMGLFAAGLGNPLHTDVPRQYTLDELDRGGYDCVYAHKGQYLYNDEIAFFHESALTINYLVVFNAK